MASRFSPMIDPRRLFVLLCSCAALSSRAAGLDYVALPPYVMTVEDRVWVKGAVVELTKELYTGTDGGGALKLYSKAGRPVEMIETIGLSNHEIVRRFLYHRGTLVLCIDRDRFFKWDPDKQELDPEKTSDEEEQRYYFKDGELVCWLTIHDIHSNEGSLTREDRKTPTEEKTDILQESSFFLKVAASKGKYADVSAYTTKGKPVFTSGDER